MSGDLRILSEIREYISNLIDTRIPDTVGLSPEQKAEICGTVYFRVFEDLGALVKKDPAANNDYAMVWAIYSTLKAVACYRLANSIYYQDMIDPDMRVWSARSISEYAKTRYNVEIHPGAQIGQYFVIDHGTGTVIGETCEIGDDCYILQGVVLGARGIAGNDSAKRHPTIGNGVQIGAFAKVLGPINIGDNVFISPNCVITEDVPANTRVTIVNQLQLSIPAKSDKVEVYGVVPKSHNILEIYGHNLTDCSVYFIDQNFDLVEEIRAEISFCEISTVQIKVNPDNVESIKDKLQQVNLRITTNGDEIIIRDSLGLRRLPCLNEVFSGGKLN